jgi:hypothetical protein
MHLFAKLTADQIREGDKAGLLVDSGAGDGER